jgi:hypothetical protein
VSLGRGSGGGVRERYQQRGGGERESGSNRHYLNGSRIS